MLAEEDHVLNAHATRFSMSMDVKLTSHLFLVLKCKWLSLISVMMIEIYKWKDIPGDQEGLHWYQPGLLTADAPI
jgi:hypothetical protein